MDINWSCFRNEALFKVTIFNIINYEPQWLWVIKLYQILKDKKTTHNTHLFWQQKQNISNTNIIFGIICGKNIFLGTKTDAILIKKHCSKSFLKKWKPFSQNIFDSCQNGNTFSGKKNKCCVYVVTMSLNCYIHQWIDIIGYES